MIKHKILKRGTLKGNPFLIHQVTCGGKALVTAVIFFDNNFYGGDSYCPFDDEASLAECMKVVEEGLKPILQELIKAKNKTS